MRIHPLAVVSPTARIAENVQIGPFCVVEPDVTIGAGCRLEAGAIVKNRTILGEDNHVFEAAVLGGLPQHVNTPLRAGKLVVGHGNTIRENVTMNRALEENHATVVGDNNMLMINSHIAHDCVVGNRVVIANSAMLGGHVTVGDRAFLSGGVGVHQFCRIGTLAMVGGQALILKDVPPYVTIDGHTGYVVGLNQIGLRRSGYSRQDILQLKAAYRVIYRSGLTWTEILSRIEVECIEPPTDEFHQFLSAPSTRGISPGRRLPADATIKLRKDQDFEEEIRTKAG